MGPRLMGRGRYESSKKKHMLAKCPRCEIVHKVYINWIGRGMPRIFCHKCECVMNRLKEACYDRDNSVT